jgi:hypothetical protein
MSTPFFYLTGIMGYLKGRGYGHGPNPGNPGTVGIGYKRPISIGKAFPWWQARYRTSKSRRKLSDTQRHSKLFTSIISNSRLHLP